MDEPFRMKEGLPSDAESGQLPVAGEKFCT
jgi:hypothetical protein